MNMYIVTFTIVTTEDKTCREHTRDKSYIYGRKMFWTVPLLKKGLRVQLRMDLSEGNPAVNITLS
jgi:hypothetical protein